MRFPAVTRHLFVTHALLKITKSSMNFLNGEVHYVKNKSPQKRTCTAIKKYHANWL